MSMLLAAFLSLSSSSLDLFPPANTNLSAIRHIVCNEGSGTGFIIKDGVLVTALHVAVMTGCEDSVTHMKYVTYHRDLAHDFAMMTGATPEMPPLKINCGGYKKGSLYAAYGHSNHLTMNTIFRRSILRATGFYPDVSIKMDDGSIDTRKGMAGLDGYIVFGQSGGPILDADTDEVVGIVNVGRFNIFGVPTGDVSSYELKGTVLCKS